jgi:hypothetical protein
MKTNSKRQHTTEHGPQRLERYSIGAQEQTKEGFGKLIARIAHNPTGENANCVGRWTNGSEELYKIPQK